MKGNKIRILGETTPPDTSEATTEKNTANNASATNRQHGQNRGNINRNNNRTLVYTEDKNYKVGTPEVS